MKILNKCTHILMAFLICLSLFTKVNADIAGHQSAISEEQADKLGNFLDNMYGHMTEEERRMFIEEVEREQEKLMKMTPEERAQKEAEVAAQLEEIMSEDSPYHDMFQAPPKDMLLEEPKQTEKTEKEIQQPVDTRKPIRRQKPKIKAGSKKQHKELVQKIVKAADSILVKANNMKEVQHKSWSKDKWVKLKSNLQSLKSQLQMAINSEVILAELTNDERKGLVDDLKNFEKVITTQSSQFKTPDSMGLVVVQNGNTTIVNEQRYNSAIQNLKKVTEKLIRELAINDLVSRIKGLISKHSPKDKKPAITKSNSPKSKPSISKKTITVCSTDQEKANAIKQIEESAGEVKRCASKQLLDMTNDYANQKHTLKTSKDKAAIDSAKQKVNALSRKLQWKLSELKVHTEKTAKTIKTVPQCKNDINKALGDLSKFQNLKDISNSLNEINDPSKVGTLAKGIKSDIDVIFFS